MARRTGCPHSVVIGVFRSDSGDEIDWNVPEGIDPDQYLFRAQAQTISGLPCTDCIFQWQINDVAQANEGRDELVYNIVSGTYIVSVTVEKEGCEQNPSYSIIVRTKETECPTGPVKLRVARLTSYGPAIVTITPDDSVVHGPAGYYLFTVVDPPIGDGLSFDWSLDGVVQAEQQLSPLEHAFLCRFLPSESHCITLSIEKEGCDMPPVGTLFVYTYQAGDTSDTPDTSGSGSGGGSGSGPVDRDNIPPRIIGDLDFPKGSGWRINKCRGLLLAWFIPYVLAALANMLGGRMPLLSSISIAGLALTAFTIGVIALWWKHCGCGGGFSGFMSCCLTWQWLFLANTLALTAVIGTHVVCALIVSEGIAAFPMIALKAAQGDVVLLAYIGLMIVILINMKARNCHFYLAFAGGGWPPFKCPDRV
jgi:hypothetical protein